MRCLTVVLTKERLAPKTMELSKKVGTTCEEMKDKSSRELIFVNGELGIRFFLARAGDVPIYVEYGAADIDISGKNTILEEGRRLYGVPDLDLGKYRMCVYGPESARELLQHHEVIRVAVKYPGIVRDYFYNRKHQTMEIIKPNGSIKLTPTARLLEVIVDIVETGSTLRENGLTVPKKVCDLSAKVIVNQVNVKWKNERVTKLTHDLWEVLAGEDVGRRRKV